MIKKYVGSDPCRSTLGTRGSRKGLERRVCFVWAFDKAMVSAIAGHRDYSRYRPLYQFVCGVLSELSLLVFQLRGNGRLR